MHRSIAAEIDNPLADSAFLWHDKFSQTMSAAHMQWVRLLRAFASSLEGSTLLVGSMFSGSEVLRVVLDVMTEFWRGMYGVNIKIQHTFMCERDTAKQRFLIEQHSPPILFREAQELGNLTAWCAIKGEAVPVPYCDLLVAGVPE